ncbi:MAG: hypothetical protein AB8U25_03235 [Rickettsiales endosymbiont of Dermacentor nuttalli]
MKSSNRFFDPFSKEDISLLMQVSAVLKQNGMQMADFGNYLQSYSKEKLRFEQVKLGKNNNQSVEVERIENETKVSKNIENIESSYKSGKLERFSEAKKSQDISTVHDKVEELSQTKAKSSKDLILTMSSSFQKTSAQIDLLLKTSDSNLSKEELKALSELNITLKKLNQDLDNLAQKSELQIQQELESTRQLEEHEEKRQKTFMDRIKEGRKEVADTLASLLLPEAWNEQAKERESNLAASQGEDKGEKSFKEPTQKHKEIDRKQEEVKENDKNKLNIITPQTKQEAESIMKSFQSQEVGQIVPQVPISKEIEQKRNQNFSQEMIPNKTRN